MKKEDSRERKTLILSKKTLLHTIEIVSSMSLGLTTLVLVKHDTMCH